MLNLSLITTSWVSLSSSPTTSQRISGGMTEKRGDSDHSFVAEMLSLLSLFHGLRNFLLPPSTLWTILDPPNIPLYMMLSLVLAVQSLRSLLMVGTGRNVIGGRWLQTWNDTNSPTPPSMLTVLYLIKVYGAL